MGKMYYCPSAFTLASNLTFKKLVPKMFKEIGLKISMDNNFGKYKGPYVKGHKLIRDSGGLQLGRGVRQSINIEKLYSSAEEQKIFGIMTVDFPLLFNYTKEDLIKQAEFQKAQTNKILKVMNIKRLYNIVHGKTFDEYNLYHKIVFNKDIHKISFAGSIRNNIHCYLACFIEFFDKWQKQYKYVHILGGYSIQKNTGALTWLLNHRYKDMILTFDNSTDNQVSKRMCLIDRKSGMKSRIPTKHFIKNCGCPLCKKYKDKFKLDFAYYNIHNVGTSLQVFRQMNEDAKNLTLSQYCKKYKLDIETKDILSGNHKKYLNLKIEGFKLSGRKEQYNLLYNKEVDKEKIKKFSQSGKVV